MTEDKKCYHEDGMSVGFKTVVIQVVAALTFVEGLKIIGVIDLLTSLATSCEELTHWKRL